MQAQLVCKLKPFATYCFILLIAPSNKGTKEHISTQAGIGTDILLVPPVLLVYGECLLSFVCIFANIGPMANDTQGMNILDHR